MLRRSQRHLIVLFHTPRGRAQPGISQNPQSGYDSRGPIQFSGTHHKNVSQAGERWWIVDANGAQLHQLARAVAFYSTGRNRPDWRYPMVMGDRVVVTNCKDVVMVGDTWHRTPMTWKTGWPAGNITVRYSHMYDRDPCLLVYIRIQAALRKMFMGQKTVIRGAMEKIYLYEDSVHPHGDMNPRPLPWDPANESRVRREIPYKTRWTVNQYMR